MAKLDLDELRKRYADGGVEPADVLAEIRDTAAATEAHNVWIHLLSEAELAPHLERLAALPRSAPLWGVPFAIKDNIDLAGVPTTAACPAYAYHPERSATTVQRLLDAGAVPVGKANLDQFATGLVGARSPYGTMRNAFDPQYIAGGSSGGSALAVALDMASFALGTDTAGSGRVPAAFNGLVGLKPTRGRLSTLGVVPACRTLDCVSVFSRRVADAEVVANAAGGYDERDSYSRHLDWQPFDVNAPRLGLFPCADLEYFGNTEYENLFAHFRASMVQRALPVTEVTSQPFTEAASLLYQGPWLAERYAALAAFLASNADDLHPVTREIIGAGDQTSAVAAFEAAYRLADLQRAAAQVFDDIDVLVLPTAPTIYTVSAVEADPITTNSRLGTYTNFVNLLDLAAIAIPAGTTTDGLPFGVTLIGRAGSDHALTELAARLSGEPPRDALAARPGLTHIAVCGAHLDGQPLNGDLVRRGGHLALTTQTARAYRLYALPDGKRPALVRSNSEGQAIEVEVWSIREREVGSFLATIAPPLGLGSIELEDGRWVTSFIAEGRATDGARDISEFGGWRRYRASL